MALQRAGSGQPTYRQILADGPFESLYWPALTTPTRQGTRSVMARAWARAQELDVDLLLYLEDDVRPCLNAIPYMLATGVPDDLAFLTYFPTEGQVSDHWANVAELGGGPAGFPLIRRLAASHYFSGNQCLAFPRRTIDYLARHYPHLSSPAWNYPNGADAWMGFLVAKGPQPFYGAHLPALVEHVGASSAAHPGLTLNDPNRRAACWPGCDFDALTLLKTPPEGPNSLQGPRS